MNALCMIAKQKIAQYMIIQVYIYNGACKFSLLLTVLWALELPPTQ